ncbi:hypothetical protein [Pseudobacter ginsenosidimutans]|uniref:Uncharacterized protein n=1 Tax=Pseudobacter ginsenosidimutans TaxID=661488 RepID=A0A4Q7N1T9_9BACT|nr:hypothetical protein [Pseudobacter ginsenosidimutans]QEC43236.1 hypothetical protein FSB84_16600 [Pseudobacter ginsenosidimutans]RZS74599.1 hypothetical protein EV199_0448 [Pseudobacter ginsenosidimutans]
MKKLFYLLVLLVFACSKSNESPGTTKKVQSDAKASLEPGDGEEPFSLISVIDDDHSTGTDLADAINTHDVSGSESALQEMSNNIANYYITTYNIDLQQEFDNDDYRIIIFGLIEELNSKYVSNPTSTDLTCFMTAVSTFIGVTQARNIWKSIATGSYNAGTVIDALKLMGKRVATVIGVGIMVYEVGACLHWWDVDPIDRTEELPPPVPGTQLDINAIPIEFFIGIETFDEIHHFKLLSFLNTNYGLNTSEAYEVIGTVINNNGDPSYSGTAMIVNYFQSDLDTN